MAVAMQVKAGESQIFLSEIRPVTVWATPNCLDHVNGDVAQTHE